MKITNEQKKSLMTILFVGGTFFIPFTFLTMQQQTSQIAEKYTHAIDKCYQTNVVVSYNDYKNDTQPTFCKSMTNDTTYEIDTSNEYQYKYYNIMNNGDINATNPNLKNNVK